MKIGFKNSNVIDVYNKCTTLDKMKTSKNKKLDSIEISAFGKEISNYIKLSKDYEILSEKLNKIKSEINKNTYKVDTDLIAKSIINELKECGRND